MLVVNSVISEKPFEKLPMFAQMSYLFFSQPDGDSTAASYRENFSLRFLFILPFIYPSK